MKKFMRNFVFCLLILSILAIGLFFGAGFETKKNVFATEPNGSSGEVSGQIQSDVSIFIRKPTYSVFYGNKLYFIDETDKLLKAYDTTNNAFDSNYLDLSSLKILDASFVDDSLFILSSSDTENIVVKINLSTFSLVSEFNVKIDKIYGSFFAQKVTFDAKNYTLITFSAPHQNAKVALVDETANTSNVYELKFNTSVPEQDNLMNNLIKTFSYQDLDGNLYVAFVYNKSIAYFSVGSIDALNTLLNSNEYISKLEHTSLPDDLNDLTELIIKNVSLAKIGTQDYIAVSFSTSDSEQHIKLYSFDFEEITQTISYATTYPCENAKYLMFNENYYSYSNENKQKLFFTKISIDTSGENPIYTQENSEIDNPNYEISYLSSENFVYKKATTLTELYEDPWGANFKILIEKDLNVIKIGTAKLIGSGLIIADYDYCLFTYSDKNYCGFIKNSNLLEKQVITPKEAGYKEIGGKCIVTIWPRTALYTLPTTISGTIGKDGSSLVSQKIMTIEDNSAIQVVDVLGNYFANNTQMIKVIVNDSQVGYIDANCVRNPSDVRDFVITNATIKNDDTTVYLSPNIDSTILSFKLNAGKNVRINGKRNTKTGFTSITFNDEYGNEFSGYIETDYIKSDSWSTLQIVGCILIAINIGLLILILIYKKNHLGNRGQKIEKEN